MAKFCFDLTTAEMIAECASSGRKSAYDMLTGPGREIADMMAHLAANHPDMGDDDFLIALTPLAYHHLSGEMT